MTDTLEVVTPPAATAGVITHNNITITLPSLPSAPQARTQAAAPVNAAKPKVIKPKDNSIWSLPESIGSWIFHDETAGLKLSGIIIPEYYMDEKTGARTTRYRDPTGAMATFTEDPKDHRKVTLTLRDASGTIVTQGNVRGFTATINGQIQKADAWRFPFSDKLSCGDSSVDMPSDNHTESVTRDKLQQFAQDNPRLASVLRKVELPATVMGELPVTFAKAVDTPTQYRACPTDRSGILLERLTEKSAPRK